MNVCFVTNTIDIACSPNVTCLPDVVTGSFDATCGIMGFGLNLVRSLGYTFVAKCISGFTSSIQGCDVVIGSLRQDIVFDSPGWIASVAYDADSTAILYRPEYALRPWAFLSPFDPSLWIVLAVIVFFVTPFVSAIVEYDRGETLIGNFKMYLPDSVHAYTGVDPLKRTGNSYSKESSMLSAFVAVVTKIVIALYSCNLAAYVIASYFQTPVAPTNIGTIATIQEFASIGNDIVVVETLEEGLHAFRNTSVRGFAADYGYIRYVQQCGELIMQMTGPVFFRVMALSDLFSGSVHFNHALRMRLQRDPVKDVVTLTCPPTVESIGLESTLGIFVAFGACISFVSLVAIIVHVYRHEDFGKKESPDAPNSLPESYHESETHT